MLSFDALKMLSWSQWMWVTAPLCPSSVRQRSVRTSLAGALLQYADRLEQEADAADRLSQGAASGARVLGSQRSSAKRFVFFASSFSPLLLPTF